MTALTLGHGVPVEPASLLGWVELGAIRALDDAYVLLGGLSDDPDRCAGIIFSHLDGWLECAGTDCPGPYAVLHDPDQVYPCMLRPDLAAAMTHRCPRCPPVPATPATRRGRQAFRQAEAGG
jgi:hypothetical protein